MRTIRHLTLPILAFLLIASVVEGARSQTPDPAQALAALKEKVLSKGPKGEEPSPASSVSLTGEELDKIRGLKAKAAIVMHYARNDWSQAQVAGLKSQFDKMGIEVIAISDAGFNPERQVINIRAALAQHPQIIVSIPTDPDITGPAYKDASQNGVKLVFMDNVPTGFVAGKDYVSVVSADNYEGQYSRRLETGAWRRRASARQESFAIGTAAKMSLAGRWFIHPWLTYVTPVHFRWRRMDTSAFGGSRA